MRTRDVDVTDDDLIHALAQYWDLAVAQIRYLPEGGGSYHWIALTPAGTRYFLTVDDLDHKPWLGADRESAFRGLSRAFGTALTLHRRAGLAFVVPPVLTRGGSVVHRLTCRYSLAVFGFADGRAGRWGEAVSSGDRGEILRLLAALHRATPLVADLARRDDLRLPGRAGLADALASLDQPWTGGPFGEPARNRLRAHADVIAGWLGTFDQLTAEVAAAGTEPVITHGEPHPGNLIRSAAGFRLIDWDTVAIAPAERDLWMLDDGSGRGLAPYRQAAGRVVRRAALDRYRLGWILADLASFASLLRAPHQANAVTRKAWRAVEATVPAGLPGPLMPYQAAR